MLIFTSCDKCGRDFTTRFVPMFDKTADIATLCDDCQREKAMNVLATCARCGKPVEMSEMDIADGYERFCDTCEDTLPGMYELVQAEKRSMDADPDWQERQGPYISEFNIGNNDEIMVANIDGDEIWRFTADSIDTLLLELELMLIGLRHDLKPDRGAIEAAFDHIKAMRARRISAA